MFRVWERVAGLILFAGRVSKDKQVFECCRIFHFQEGSRCWLGALSSWRGSGGSDIRKEASVIQKQDPLASATRDPSGIQQFALAECEPTAWTVCDRRSTKTRSHITQSHVGPATLESYNGKACSERSGALFAASQTIGVYLRNHTACTYEFMPCARTNLRV